MWITKILQVQEPMGLHERGQWLAKLLQSHRTARKKKMKRSEQVRRELNDAELREITQMDTGDEYVREGGADREWSLE